MTYARRMPGMERIWLLFDASGDCEMLAFLDQLSGTERRKLLARLQRADLGHPLGTEQYRGLGPRLCEFKLHSPRALRVYAFVTSRGYVLCFGAPKAKPEVTQRHIARLRRMKEVFHEHGGHYR